jgi:outer membrane receptor protein involved in Fe transport
MQLPASFLVIALVAQTQETITVTATRTPAPLGDTAASVAVISQQTLATTAAATIDDALRQVPGFTLFRRSGSATANPTSQGVSLRGIGASGASRAVVLDDGIPLNDAFGGWIYWGRIPRAAVDRIEVLRGGASDLYGSAAMGGVVQFVRRAAAPSAIVIDASAGSQRTALSSVFASTQRGEWSGSVAGDFYNTAGYVLVQPDQRGTVDQPADSWHNAIDATLARHFGETDRLFLRASHYRESRDNGTPMQTNDTTTRQLAAGGDAVAGGGALLLRAYATDQDYAQTFSAIAANRNSERLTVDQKVPSRSAGATMQWSRAINLRQSIVAGAEARRVTGESDETQVAATGAITHAVAGGRQRDGSLFLQDIIAATPRLAVTAALRFDTWRNFDAHRNGAPLADRSDSAWSPRLSVLYHAADRLSLTASAYRAFRAPTLNELYRGFRLGNVLTLANENLGAERMTAVEAGVRVESSDRRRAIRATLFSMNTTDTIANVTLSTTPSLITRQRQNLGSSRSRGVELEGETRIVSSVHVAAGYLFSDATVSGGSRVPQVPRHQATMQLTTDVARATFALQGRWSTSQFDDDLNQLLLRSYTVVDAFVSHPLYDRLTLTFTAENIFNRRIEVSATPVVSLGQPRAGRVGVRYRFAGRK